MSVEQNYPNDERPMFERNRSSLLDDERLDMVGALINTDPDLPDLYLLIQDFFLERQDSLEKSIQSDIREHTSRAIKDENDYGSSTIALEKGRSKSQPNRFISAFGFGDTKNKLRESLVDIWETKKLGDAHLRQKIKPVIKQTSDFFYSRVSDQDENSGKYCLEIVRDNREEIVKILFYEDKSKAMKSRPNKRWPLASLEVDFMQQEQLYFLDVTTDDSYWWDKDPADQEPKAIAKRRKIHYVTPSKTIQITEHYQSWGDQWSKEGYFTTFQHKGEKINVYTHSLGEFRTNLRTKVNKETNKIYQQQELLEIDSNQDGSYITKALVEFEKDTKGENINGRAMVAGVNPELTPIRKSTTEEVANLSMALGCRVGDFYILEKTNNVGSELDEVILIFINEQEIVTDLYKCPTTHINPRRMAYGKERVSEFTDEDVPFTLEQRYYSGS